MSECRPWKEAPPDFRLRASAGLSRLLFAVSTFSRLFFGCSFFFLHATGRQLLTHKIYGAPATGRVRACARSRCVVTFRLTRGEGMLLPLTHLMICLLFFFFFSCPVQQGNPTQSGGGEQLAIRQQWGVSSSLSRCVLELGRPVRDRTGSSFLKYPKWNLR